MIFGVLCGVCCWPPPPCVAVLSSHACRQPRLLRLLLLSAHAVQRPRLLRLLLLCLWPLLLLRLWLLPAACCACRCGCPGTGSQAVPRCRGIRGQGNRVGMRRTAPTHQHTRHPQPATTATPPTGHLRARARRRLHASSSFCCIVARTSSSCSARNAAMRRPPSASHPCSGLLVMGREPTGSLHRGWEGRAGGQEAAVWLRQGGGNERQRWQPQPPDHPNPTKHPTPPHPSSSRTHSASATARTRTACCTKGSQPCTPERRRVLRLLRPSAACRGACPARCTVQAPVAFLS